LFTAVISLVFATAIGILVFHFIMCYIYFRPMNFLYLSWYKKSESVKIGNRTKIAADNQKYVFSKHGRVLTIRQPTRADSGLYMCEALFSRPGEIIKSPVVAEARLLIFGEYFSDVLLNCRNNPDIVLSIIKTTPHWVFQIGRIYWFICIDTNACASNCATTII